jgi:ATP-independent RNA helicase DbpA
VTDQTATAFASLPLSTDMLNNLVSLGYTEMTPIQAQSLPLMLKGIDLIAQAKTGSGKTAAFGIALLSRLNPRSLATQSLILCPTRELADQVAQELRRLARAISNIKILVLGGGVAMNPQVDSLEHGAHIVVGTAGRIQKHLDKGSLRLDQLNTLVLDEADRMLDMGFYDSIEAIIKQADLQARTSRQTLLFSATYPAGIKKIAADFMQDPAQVTIAEQHSNTHIEQRCYEINPEQRFDVVTNVLHHYRPESCVAFCFTKQQCQELTEHLIRKGISAQALNGDLDQRDRDQVVTMFANKSISVLVATDVAARGLDIAGLDLVINVELTGEPETHIHRIGRTGRAGATGVAVSLIAPREARRAALIEALQAQPFVFYPLSELTGDAKPLQAAMMTIALSAGRKDKLRAGDILGALTGENGLPASKIGKITITDMQSYVAIESGSAKQALKRITTGKVKGRLIKARLLTLS